MYQSYWRLLWFAMAAAAAVLIGGCADSDTPTAAKPGVGTTSGLEPGVSVGGRIRRPNAVSYTRGSRAARPPPPPCLDEPTAMAEEYKKPSFENTLRPACDQFTASGGSANFSWHELNGRGYLSSPPYGNPHYENGGWGLIMSSLTTGLEETRSIDNRGGIALSGAYRCPHGNNQRHFGGPQQLPHPWQSRGHVLR